MLTTIWYVWLMNVAIDPSAVCPFSTRDTHIPGQLQCSRWNVPSFSHSLLKNAAASQMWPVCVFSYKRHCSLFDPILWDFNSIIYIAMLSCGFFWVAFSPDCSKKERYISVKLFIRRHGFVSENCADICWLQQLHQLTSYFWEPQKNASKTLLSIVRGGLEEWLSWPDFVYFTFGSGKIGSVLPVRSFPFHH